MHLVSLMPVARPDMYLDVRLNCMPSTGLGMAPLKAVNMHLQALHALCLTDVALCMPPQDAAKYVRCLAPYLKVSSPKAGQRSPDRDRRDAECLLCKLVRLITYHNIDSEILRCCQSASCWASSRL